jgi:hypothetical protein
MAREPRSERRPPPVRVSWTQTRLASRSCTTPTPPRSIAKIQCELSQLACHRR